MLYRLVVVPKNFKNLHSICIHALSLPWVRGPVRVHTRTHTYPQIFGTFTLVCCSPIVWLVGGAQPVTRQSVRYVWKSGYPPPDKSAQLDLTKARRVRRLTGMLDLGSVSCGELDENRHPPGHKSRLPSRHRSCEPKAAVTSVLHMCVCTCIYVCLVVMYRCAFQMTFRIRTYTLYEVWGRACILRLPCICIAFDFSWKRINWSGEFLKEGKKYEEPSLYQRQFSREARQLTGLLDHKSM